LAALSDPRARFLESLPKLNVTEPTFDGGKRFFVVVLEGSGYKLKFSPKWDDLRGDARFEKIVAAVAAPLKIE
jgi:hypothetical protein